MAKAVNLTCGHAVPTTGTAGLKTQLPRRATSVSAVAGATGGISAGNLVRSDVG